MPDWSSAANIADVPAEMVAVATLVFDEEGPALWRKHNLTVADLTHPDLAFIAATFLTAIDRRGEAVHLDIVHAIDQQREPSRWHMCFEIGKHYIASPATYLRAVKVCSEQRKVAAMAAKALQDANNPRLSPYERSDALARVRSIELPELNPGETQSKLDLLDELCEAELSGVEVIDPVPTSLRCLDELTFGGYRPGRLYVISTEPGNGKTSFVLGSAIAVMRSSKRVAVVSMEMSEKELIHRMRSYISEVPLLNGAPAPAYAVPAIRDAYSDLYEFDWKIKGGAVRSMREIADWLAAQNAETPLGLVIIDYLGKIPTPRAEREDIGIGQNVSACKTIAQVLNVPVLLVAQPNREHSKRDPNARYRMSDLRGSGQIEADADAILFLWQPAHNSTEYPVGYAEIDVVKHRHGKRKTMRIEWRGDIYKYTDAESDEVLEPVVYRKRTY